MLLNHQAMLPQGATVATDTRHGSAFVGVLARKPGRQHQGGWTLAGSVQVFLQVELLLGLGKTLREIIEIAGADQLTPGGWPRGGIAQYSSVRPPRQIDHRGYWRLS
jgi:hypothetical protein